MDMRDIDIKRRGAHRVDDQDMDVTVMPADDARTIFPTERFLPIGDHVVLLYTPLRAGNGTQRIPAMTRSISASVSDQSLSRSAITFLMNGSESAIARSLSPRWS